MKQGIIKGIKDRIVRGFGFKKFERNATSASTKSKDKFGMMGQKNQSGRGMVEMLGVLAIIGVLTIGSIWGYNYAIKIHRVNEITEMMNRQAVLASAAKAVGVDLPEDEWDTTAAGFSIEYNPTYEEDGVVYDNFFTITVRNVPKDMLEMLIKRDDGRAYQILIDGIPVDEYDFKNFRRIEKVSFLNLPFVKPAYADDEDDTADVTKVYEDDLDGEDDEDDDEDDICRCQDEHLIVCVSGFVIGCEDDTVCVQTGPYRAECLPPCFIYYCPNDEGGWDPVDDDTGGGSGGSHTGGGSSGGHTGGSSGGGGSGQCKNPKPKYLPKTDPKCPCAGKDCGDCGCNKETGDCYEEKMIQTGKCCDEGEKKCCKKNGNTCEDCVKDDDCRECTKEQEGKVWCSSDITKTGCTDGKLWTEDCVDPKKCHDDGEGADCKNPCEYRTDCSETCGCDEKTGECIEEIEIKTGDCCDEGEGQKCCKGTDGCVECQKTENCDLCKKNNVRCICGTCDPQTGNCDPPDEECEDCMEKCKCEGNSLYLCKKDLETNKPSWEFIRDCGENKVCSQSGGCGCREKCETEGEVKCFDDRLKICLNGGWETLENCADKDCGHCENGECKPGCNEKECKVCKDGSCENKCFDEPCGNCDGNGNCFNICEKEGMICCSDDLTEGCRDDKCKEVTCLCAGAKCDPCTGKCDPPDEECCEDGTKRPASPGCCEEEKSPIQINECDGSQCVPSVRDCCPDDDECNENDCSSNSDCCPEDCTNGCCSDGKCKPDSPDCCPEDKDSKGCCPGDTNCCPEDCTNGCCKDGTCKPDSPDCCPEEKINDTYIRCDDCTPVEESYEGCPDGKPDDEPCPEDCCPSKCTNGCCKDGSCKPASPGCCEEDKEPRSYKACNGNKCEEASTTCCPDDTGCGVDKCVDDGGCCPSGTEWCPDCE